MSLVIWPRQSQEWTDAMRNAAGNLTVLIPASEAEALEAAQNAEGWVGRLTPELLNAAPRLRWLQALSISLEDVAFPGLAESAVTLTHLRHIYDDHIANHVLAFLLAYCRDLPRLLRQQREGRWSAGGVNVKDPAALTVLVMGLGGIGAETARRIAVLGSTIIGVDPRLESPPEGVTTLVRPDQLSAWLPQSDVVVICAPLTPQTQGLFDEAMFRQMKPGAFFINIGRGKIVRLEALERALAEGWLSGAALDVFETEPLPADSPLWQMNNVLITPHIAAAGPLTEDRRLAVIVENVRRFSQNEPLLYVADKMQWY
jgi:phosphoglycerate dehydrogenase-like enzyme